MLRTKSLKTLQRQIRNLQTQAEKLERAEQPGIKQLRSVLLKYNLGSADIKLALNGKRQRVGRRQACGTKG